MAFVVDKDQNSRKDKGSGTISTGLLHDSPKIALRVVHYLSFPPFFSFFYLRARMTACKTVSAEG